MAEKASRHSAKTGKSDEQRGGVAELERSEMMAHLLRALDEGKSIGHYGRLVFSMVARHFLDEDELIGYLQKDPDFSEQEARALYLQVQGRDYSPPKRDKILAWQALQGFPICPNPDDPSCCNVYQELRVPEDVYEHIGEFYEERAEAEEEAA